MIIFGQQNPVPFIEEVHIFVVDSAINDNTDISVRLAYSLEFECSTHCVTRTEARNVCTGDSKRAYCLGVELERTITQ